MQYLQFSHLGQRGIIHYPVLSVSEHETRGTFLAAVRNERSVM
jgi:hypothetical protein